MSAVVESRYDNENHHTLILRFSWHLFNLLVSVPKGKFQK
jgi:hypothetical protein